MQMNSSKNTFIDNWSIKKAERRDEFSDLTFLQSRNDVYQFYCNYQLNLGQFKVTLNKSSKYRLLDNINKPNIILRT
jgi:hypothetical protein